MIKQVKQFYAPLMKWVKYKKYLCDNVYITYNVVIRAVTRGWLVRQHNRRRSESAVMIQRAYKSYIICKATQAVKPEQ